MDEEIKEGISHAAVSDRVMGTVTPVTNAKYKCNGIGVLQNNLDQLAISSKLKYFKLVGT